MNNKKIVPLILCGGKGNRLWPLSRPSYPKQFLSLGKNNDKTLLQNTLKRISKLENVENPILICNEENRFLVAEQIREINIKPKAIILEPFGRGTAPAITIGALQLLKNQDNPYLLVLSSDHEVSCNEKFIKSIESGLIYASKGKLVTFGVVPNEPSTAYGYIESEEPLSEKLYRGSRICSFIEKPAYDKAKIFLNNARFSWNSGIFLFKTNSFINEINNFEPKLFEDCKESINESKIDLDFLRINKKNFLKCKNISVDVAVMEKTKNGIVVPLNAGWRDLGSWSEVWESSEKDQNGNSTNGKIILKNCSNNFIHSESRLVAGIGLKDLVIVETSDALLVLNKIHSQKVKELVEELNKKIQPEGLEHKKIFRPWGSYTTLAEDLNWKVKKIVVKPYQSLSLQMHEYRTEHWIVLKGKAKVEINGKTSFLNENQSTYIPLESKHRLSNDESTPLLLIEVQSGISVEEKDIIRFEDKYGRVKK
tara:strand:+ start:3852 stop:5294 length:1443 start_codon:yes stop_codon:yes gene_type:complete